MDIINQIRNYAKRIILNLLNLNYLLKLFPIEPNLIQIDNIFKSYLL